MTNTYKLYLAVKETIDPTKHIIAKFTLASEGQPFDRTAGGIAAESSVGTWTDVSLEKKDIWDRLHAKIIEKDESSDRITVAYPLDLFEEGNIPQFLSSITGNIFGLKEISKLRLEDLDFPERYVRSFPGPALGIEGIRKLTGVWDRPLLGSIIKPKLGLTSSLHAEAAFTVLDAGLDLVKDDENLTSQVFNNFYSRVDQVISKLKSKHYLKIGQAKIYAFNISASWEEMMKRGNYVRDQGGNCLMLDILTVGFAGVCGIRNRNYGLMLHGHRAMHAAFTRSRQYGISMLVIAKLARLAGLDSLHTGTVLGKMEGGKKEVLTINNFLRSEWYGLKTVLPTASGGLHPELVPTLVKILGNDTLFNFGGGIHGHPAGSYAGAIAAIQALNATVQNIELAQYSQTHPELSQALSKWKRS